MGSWGTYPKDSDGALDLQSIVNKAIDKELESITAKYDGYDYAGLILLLLQKGFFIKYKFIEKAVGYIKIELDRTKNGNLSGWAHPAKAVKDMEHLVSEFEQILNEEKQSVLKAKKRDGKNLTNRSEAYRLKILQDIGILAPCNWLMRKEERNKKSWSGIFDLS